MSKLVKNRPPREKEEPVRFEGESEFRGGNVGAFIIRIGFPLKGSLRGSFVGFYSIEALIIRIGSGGGGILSYDFNKESSK